MGGKNRFLYLNGCAFDLTENIVGIIPWRRSCLLLPAPRVRGSTDKVIFAMSRIILTQFRELFLKEADWFSLPVGTNFKDCELGGGNLFHVAVVVQGEASQGKQF